MKKLSIIIPVYNNEKDIKKLLDILLVQKNENVEIVCINDGSTDDSQKILEQYADETFVRVFNQENGGVSSARNLGLTVAKGEYITFIDGDDFVTDDYVETVLKLVNSHQECDLYLFNSFVAKSDEVVKNKWLLDIEDGLITLSQYLNEYAKGKISFLANSRYVIWNQIYKRSIIVDNQICFNTSVKRMEDNIFELKYLNNVDNIYAINKALYYHTLNPLGLTFGGTNDLQDKEQVVYDNAVFFNEYIAFCNEHNIVNAGAFYMDVIVGHIVSFTKDMKDDRRYLQTIWDIFDKYGVNTCLKQLTFEGINKLFVFSINCKNIKLFYIILRLKYKLQKYKLYFRKSC